METVQRWMEGGIWCTFTLHAKSLHVAGGSKAVKDGKGHKKKKGADAEEEEEETYYDAMKKDMGDRAARTKVHKPLACQHCTAMCVRRLHAVQKVIVQLFA